MNSLLHMRTGGINLRAWCPGAVNERVSLDNEVRDELRGETRYLTNVPWNAVQVSPLDRR